MAWTTVSAGPGAADPAVRAQSRWRGRTGATATGLSPRKVRLATGSLRRSFFTLGRLLALTSWQLSMVRPAPTEQALGSEAAAPEGSELSPPREKSRRLREAAARTPDTHWVDPPLRPGSGSALPAEGGAGQGSACRRRGALVPSAGPRPRQEWKRSCRGAHGSATQLGSVARPPASGSPHRPGYPPGQRARAPSAPTPTSFPLLSCPKRPGETGCEGGRWGKPGFRDQSVPAGNCKRCGR